LCQRGFLKVDHQGRICEVIQNAQQSKFKYYFLAIVAEQQSSGEINIHIYVVSIGPSEYNLCSEQCQFYASTTIPGRFYMHHYSLLVAHSGW
jgi:hypothetical protein